MENLLEEMVLQCLPPEEDHMLTASVLEHAIANNGDLWGLLQPYAHLNAGRTATGTIFNNTTWYYYDHFISDIPILFTTLRRDLGIVITNKKKFHDHIHSVAHSLLKSTLVHAHDFIVTLYTALVHPFLEFSSVMWNIGYVSDIKLSKMCGCDMGLREYTSVQHCHIFSPL